nr:aminomethyl-transferring glycine dehydrogenase subunit GcvPA [candidate division Zixibacteria bacterium]
MSYIPNTDDDRHRMLEKIGADKIDDLFCAIPENLRLKNPLNLPKSLSEMELMREIEGIAARNRGNLTIFAGGGTYDHFIPTAVEVISSRPEFVTAYTPYQAEVSQGTLQVIYEFQSHICRLTGMDVANASMYDGASAAAEAAMLSAAKTGRSKILISDTVSPLFRNVIRTYLSGQKIEIVELSQHEGTTDFDLLKKRIDGDTAGIILAQPNFFGMIEDVERGGEIAHASGAHLILAIDPIAAAVLKSPAECGADIVIGEGQPLGIPLNFGGSLLGFFAVKKELIRLLPGRLAARTDDDKGNTGFVLTLQTREQHIRREKATSNICTNQALSATMATIYLSLMGKQGLKRVALLSMDKAHRAADMIFANNKYRPYFKGAFIREFVVKTPVPARELIDRAIRQNSVLPGINLGRFYHDMDDALLVAFTEKRTDDEINALARVLNEI